MNVIGENDYKKGEKNLTVLIHEGGDVAILINKEGIRFRFPGTGGGNNYSCVRNVLILLAEAIRKYNEDSAL